MCEDGRDGDPGSDGQDGSDGQPGGRGGDGGNGGSVTVLYPGAFPELAQVVDRARRAAWPSWKHIAALAALAAAPSYTDRVFDLLDSARDDNPSAICHY